MLDKIRRALEQYEGQWMLPDDLDALLEIIGDAIAEGPEYSIGESVHWPECWHYASHHACAVAEVERWKEHAMRNRAETIRLLNKVGRLTDTLDERGRGDNANSKM